MDTMKNRRQLVFRLAGEAALIVVSVYTAIVLEGVAVWAEQIQVAIESLDQHLARSGCA